MFKQACLFCKIVGGVAVAGALNWALVGIFDFNLVSAIFGEYSAVTKIIYVIVGLSGLALLASFFMVCPACKKP